MNLQDYGYHYEIDCGNFIPARIVEHHRERYKIICIHGERDAVLTGTFRHEAAANEDFPAVGDFVLLRYDNNQCGIVKLLPRKSKFSRSDFSGRDSDTTTAGEQIVAGIYSSNRVIDG